MSYGIYTGMLKMHESFRPATALREQYGLSAIAEEGDPLTRALRVME